METNRLQYEVASRQPEGLRQSWLFAGLLALAALMTLLSAQRLQGQNGNYPPLGYWRFEGNTPALQRLNQITPLHPVNINANQLLVGNADPIVGQYYSARDWSPSPGVDYDVDLNARDVSLSIEFWIRVKPSTWSGNVHWVNKCQLSFADNAIDWIVETFSGPRKLHVELFGIGAADPYQILDRQWHHVAAVYSSKTGEQRIYIDGVCPPGFFIHHQNGTPILDGANLHFTHSGPTDHLVVDMDEFAAYDTIIPPQLVWEHYQAGLAHQPYSFQQASAVATYPFPPPVQEADRNPLEFAAGYPNVPLTPLQLFNSYPHPRYSPTDSIRPLLPWVSDTDPFYNGGTLIQSNYDARIIFERLAHEWNYYLFCGGIDANYAHIRNPALMADPSRFINQMISMINAPQNAGLPRSLLSNWGNMSQALVYQSTSFRTKPYIFLQAPEGGQTTHPDLAENFFIRDFAMATALHPMGPIVMDGVQTQRKNYAMGRLPGDPRMDSIRSDGQMVSIMVDTFMSKLSSPYLDMMGENDEAVGLLDPAFVFGDAEIQADYAANFSGQSGNDYQGFRGNQLRQAYQKPWLTNLQGINLLAGRAAPEAYWYDLGGQEDAYAFERDILQYRDPKPRSSPYFYPQAPQFWRHGRGPLFGMDQTAISCEYQQLAGDSLMIPAVSAGFQGGGIWAIDDTEMNRPGQFLGQLKGLACMGAESYSAFMYHGSSLYSTGSWRIWQMPMLSYAQGVTSRLQRFLYDGELLQGDIMNGPLGVQPMLYSFTTGNANDFITGRKMRNQLVYLISASAQRTGNQQSQGPKHKLVSFRLHDNGNNAVFTSPFVIEERLQGSTYVLDRSNVNAPIFYQLDKWHEWKEPSRWCRDFDFEAEVWDSASGTPAMVTERPVPASSGDFSQFTTYISQPSSANFTQYRLRPTGSDQDTLYLWLNARSSNGQAGIVYVRMRGIPGVQQLEIPAGSTAWGWHGTAVGGLLPIQFSGLDTTEQVLEVATSGSSIQLDRLLLKRSQNAPLQIANAVINSATRSVCLSDTATFLADSYCHECNDFFWDFGDSTLAYGDNSATCANVVKHRYQYPGDYVVTLTLSDHLSGSSQSDTVHVHVGAPVVDAGPDTLVCRGGAVQLVNATTTSPFHWHTPGPTMGSLSDTTILHPVATVDSSQYFYITATDAQGCSMTDSLWVTAVGLQVAPTPDTTWICVGDAATLSVQGGFSVAWFTTAGPIVPSTPSIVVTPAQSTKYYYRATDICHCFTVLDSIMVMVRGIQEGDTTICLGGTATFHAVGNSTWLWVPGVTTGPTLSVSPSVTTTYELRMDTVDGCVTDQVTVTVDPYPCCDVPGVPRFFRPRATNWLSTWGGVFNGGTYHVVDTFFIDASVTFTNTHFYMDSMAVVYVMPGKTLTTSNCTFENACPWMWRGVKLQDGNAALVSTQDQFLNAENAVYSRNGAPFMIRKSTFRGCWVGVVAGPFNGLGAVHPGSIEGCYFGAATLLPPYASQPFSFAGVQLQNVASFTLGAPLPNGWTNTFEKLQHGVYSDRSGLQLYNNTFNLMRRLSGQANLGTGAGVRCLSPTGTGLPGGSVQAGHGTATTQPTLGQYGNTFNNCPFGVYVKGNHTVRVRGNTFYGNATGTFVTGQTLTSIWIDYNRHDQDSLGVAMSTCYRITGHVDWNQMTGSTNLPGGLHHGIRCDGVGFLSAPSSYPFRIYKNTLSLRGNGIWVNTGNKMNIVENTITILPQFPNDRLRGIYVNSSPNCRVNLNHLFSNGLGATLPLVEGVHVFASNVTSVTCNDITKLGHHVVFEQPCSLSTFKGNIMTSGVSGLVYLHQGFIGDQGTLFSPSDNLWFGTFSLSHTHAALSNGMQSRLAVRNTGNYFPAMNTNSGFLSAPMLPNTPANGPLYQCPIALLVPNKVGAIVELARSTTGTTAIDSAIKYRAYEWAYEEILADSLLLTADTAIQALHDSIAATSLGAASRARLALELRDTVEAIVEAKLVVSTNEILFNYEGILSIATDSLGVDSLDIEKLSRIAATCEDLGGRAVNLARSMLASASIFVWDDPECGTLPAYVKKRVESISEIATGSRTARCWPNPTGGQLYLQIEGEESPLKLTVRGCQGELLLSQDFDNIGDTIILDTHRWAQGLVMVLLEAKSGRRYSWKVLLQR